MAEKPGLARGGTMAVTAKEADELLGTSRPDADAGTRGQAKKLEDIMSEKPAEKKAKLAKAGTMVGTAKEADRLLGSSRPDADAGTRAQAKKIEDMMNEKPAAKKAKMAKAGTMVGTAKEGSSLLGGEKLGDTRLVTKAKKARASLNKSTSMKRTIEESAWTTGTDRVDVNAGRKLRPRKKVEYAPPKKTATKRSKSKGGPKAKAAKK